MAAPETTYADDLELLRASAVTAGIIAAGYFRRELKTWTKEKLDVLPLFGRNHDIKPSTSLRYKG